MEDGVRDGGQESSAASADPALQACLLPSCHGDGDKAVAESNPSQSKGQAGSDYCKVALLTV